MLHAKFLRSPYANAVVTRVDTTRARALSGVVDILTWEDEDIKNIRSFGEHWGAPRPWLDQHRRPGRHRGGCDCPWPRAKTSARKPFVCWTSSGTSLPHVVDLLEGRKPDAYVIRPQIRTPITFGAPGTQRNPEPAQAGGTSLIPTSLPATWKPASGKPISSPSTICTCRRFASHMPNPSGSVAWWSDDFLRRRG